MGMACSLSACARHRLLPAISLHPRCFAGSSSHGGFLRGPNTRMLSATQAFLLAQRTFAAQASFRPTLRELWHRPLAGEALGTDAQATASPRAVSVAALRSRLQSAHHWEMQRIFGDPMSSAPPSAKHLFISCAIIEGIFLCVNISTMSPFIFEMVMPYHLKYTGLIIGWWGGTYLGLNIARYGPLSHGIWFAARTAAGPIFVLVGVTGLALADGVPGMPKLGPWPSYWVLITSFTGMAAFDLALHRRQMLPPWLLRWKLGISGLIVASLLLGVLKGQYLEKHATDIIMAQAVSDDL